MRVAQLVFSQGRACGDRTPRHLADRLICMANRAGWQARQASLAHGKHALVDDGTGLNAFGCRDVTADALHLCLEIAILRA